MADIFLDTLARVSGNVDPNDEREQIKLFERLTRMIELSPDPTRQITLWIAAHTRKLDTSKSANTKPDISDVSGSAQRTGQCDSLFAVSGRAKRPRTLQFLKLREEPETYPDEIKYTYSNGELVVHPPKAKEEPTAPKVVSSKVPDRIMAALKSTPEKKWTRYALKSHLECVSGAVVAACLDSLCKRGIITAREESGTTVYRAVPPDCP